MGIEIEKPKEIMTYKSLNEALLAGAEFTHVGDNGEYVEYLSYEDGTYFIRRFVFGQCVMAKTFKSIKSILRYKKYAIWKSPEIGKLKKYYSLEEIKENLKEVLDIKNEERFEYHMYFFRDRDEYSNYELAISKYFNTLNKYYVEAKNIRLFGFNKSIFMRVAKEDESYLKYCSELIEVLKNLKLEDGWYKTVNVKIENLEVEF